MAGREVFSMAKQYICHVCGRPLTDENEVIVDGFAYCPQCSRQAMQKDKPQKKRPSSARLRAVESHLKDLHAASSSPVSSAGLFSTQDQLTNQLRREESLEGKSLLLKGLIFLLVALVAYFLFTILK